jgi:hypothetical protein
MSSRTTLVLPILTAALLAGPAHASSCAALFAETAPAALKLEYSEFDQTPGKGFRALAEKGCDKEAADLIEQYIEQNKAGQSSLRWHLAQTRALAGQKEDAIKHARASLWPEAAATGQSFKWNDYVLGTIAFLEGDKAKLIEHRDRVADYINMHKSNRGNLGVLNRLVANFGKPYKEALKSAPAAQ